MELRRVLIVRANGEMRISKRRASVSYGKNLFPLNPDEVAFPLVITIPDTWARYYAEEELRLSLGNPPKASIASADDKRAKA